jgi:hypothetical protein
VCVTVHVCATERKRECVTCKVCVTETERVCVCERMEVLKVFIEAYLDSLLEPPIVS